MYTGSPGCGYGYSYPYYGGYSYPYYGYYPYGYGMPSMRSRVPACTSMHAHNTALSHSSEVPCVWHGMRRSLPFAFSGAVGGPGLHTLPCHRAGSSARLHPLSVRCRGLNPAPSPPRPQRPLCCRWLLLLSGLWLLLLWLPQHCGVLLLDP